MTSDIIAAIDGALTDWQVSADAMRWRPDQPPTRSTPANSGQLYLTDGNWLPLLSRLMPMTLHLQQAERELLREIVRTTNDQIDQINTALRQITRAFRHANRDHYTLWPPAKPHDHGADGIWPALNCPVCDQPEDVRARALRLRQTRNTGPVKPPPGHRSPRTMHTTRPSQRYTPTHTGRSARPKPVRGQR